MNLHKLHKSELEGLVWVIEQPTPGQVAREIKLNWDAPIGPGIRLGDTRYSRLLTEFQDFIRLATTKPKPSVRMKAGSLYSTFTGLIELARFMHTRGLTSITEITSEESWNFVEYFRYNYQNGSADIGRPRAVTYASALKVLHPLTQIHALALELRSEGLAFLPEPPYGGMSTYAVATSYLQLAKSAPHEPIPDPISVPVLSRAAVWVSEGGRDVVELTRSVMGLLQSSSKRGRYSSFKLARNEITSFQFSLDSKTGKPWRLPIKIGERKDTSRKALVQLSIFQSMRRLVIDMMGACVILIQGTTGMRAHEVIGLLAGPHDDQWAGCIESEPSSDGLMEIFYFAGVTAKRRAESHRWTAGLRPYGSSSLPLPVQAANVLKQLLAPLRRLSGDDHLLVTFKARKSFPRDANSVGRFTSETLTRIQRDFAIEALLDAGYGATEAQEMATNVRGQRWRTTFAHAVFRTDPQLLGALRDHYRHLSELVTDKGYIGSDASLLEDLESERIQSTAHTLLQMATGKRLGAGSVQRLIMRNKDQLANDIAQMDGHTSTEKAIAYVKMNDVRIWNGRYASCLINLLPQASRCNKHAALSPSFAVPNYANRSPSLCASCNCCVIQPEHKDFWTARLSENMEIVRAEEQSGDDRSGRSIATRRVAQSRAILRAIGSL